MKKFILLPLILVGCTAPVTHPPAEACSPPLERDAKFECPPDIWIEPKPRPKPTPSIKKEYMRGEIDVWNPSHIIQMQQMFIRNARRDEIERNMTQPDDAINKALMEFNNGSDGSTEQEELLQL